jgi:hypothetical protein
MNQLTTSSPATYYIQVQGWLNESWSEDLGGLTISARLDADRRPVTTLTGELLDQAALLGVLTQVYDLGLPLMLVQWLTKDETDSS